MKKYYKVVWNRDGRLVSVCQDSRFPEELRVEYKVGEWVSPTLLGAKLFIFDSLDNASHLCSTMLNSEVYECEVQGHVGIPKYLAFIPDIRRFWHQKLHKYTIRPYSFTNIPSGTRTASAVKLVKKVLNSSQHLF